MDVLPVEIIELILGYSKLKLVDLINFSSTNSFYRNVVNSSSYIWKKKYHQRWALRICWNWTLYINTSRWPQYEDLFDSSFTEWYKEIRHICELKKRTRVLLTDMAFKMYKKTELSDSDFAKWDEIVAEHPRSYQYLTADLMQIVNNSVPIRSIRVVPLE